MSLGVPFSAFCLMEGEGRYSDVDPDFEPVDLDPGGSWTRFRGKAHLQIFFCMVLHNKYSKNVPKKDSERNHVLAQSK